MNVRFICYHLLNDICIEKKYSNLLLRHGLEGLGQKDKALATSIIYGTLQNYRLCRYEWICFVKQLPPAKVCVLLDMSVYQLLFMDKLPSYAIINESVDITKRCIHSRYAKLVNALLHKVEVNGKRSLSGSVEEQLAIETSHPTWLIQMWSAQYSFDVAKRIAYSDMETRKTTARVNTLKINRTAFLKDHFEYEASEICPDAMQYSGNHLAVSEEYQQGLVSIQDEASQLVAYLLDPKPNDHILDACSAPGTKASHIAQLMNDEGEIICGDIHAHRVTLIEEGAKRLGITCIKGIQLDATILEGFQEECFDRVLCDVPCSGYGVLANKSDIKYHMQSNDMDTLIPLQQAILQRCAAMVKPGGVLVYSTCTLNKKENEKQIEAFLKQHPQYQLEKQETIFPFQHHTDGFYMAKLLKHKKNI